VLPCNRGRRGRQLHRLCWRRGHMRRQGSSRAKCRHGRPGHRTPHGTYKDYWYAWKGGPRLRGEPGSPEFHASYNAAVATKIAAPEGRLLRLLQEYQRGQNFLGLRDKTRGDYVAQIKKIELRFGDMPIKALGDRRAACSWTGATNSP
jgi:hypothetical protein